MKKLRFLWSVPTMAMIVLLYSCLEREKVSSGDFAAKSASGETFKATGLKIGKITWEGNTKYTDQELNSILGVAPGDACDTIQIYAALNGGATPNGKDLLSLYMDRGYLFFRVEPKIKVNGNIADISIRVYEGSIAKIGKVTFSGIKKVNALELLEKVETKPGELFSRIKLINSQRILSEMGKFDPKDIQINPIPDWQSSDKDGVVKTDIVFKVREI